MPDQLIRRVHWGISCSAFTMPVLCATGTTHWSGACATCSMLTGPGAVDTTHGAGDQHVKHTACDTSLGQLCILALGPVKIGPQVICACQSPCTRLSSMAPHAACALCWSPLLWAALTAPGPAHTLQATTCPRTGLAHGTFAGVGTAYGTGGSMGQILKVVRCWIAVCAGSGVHGWLGARF